MGHLLTASTQLCVQQHVGDSLPGSEGTCQETQEEAYFSLPQELEEERVNSSARVEEKGEGRR